MDETGGHIAGAEPGDAGDDLFEKGARAGLRGEVGQRGEIVAADIVEQPVDRRLIVMEGEPLEGADADMRMRQPHQYAGARRRGLVAANQRLAGFDQAEGLGGVDAERLQHLGGEDFAHAALQA